MNSRGQVEGYEPIIAALVLLLMIGAFISFWQFSMVRLDNESDLKRTQMKILETFNTLNGDTNSERGGLVNERRILSTEKMQAFENANYDTLREVLLIEDYDFYFRIYDSGNTYLEKGTKTINDAIGIQRPLNYNGTIVIGELILYEK